MIIHSIEPYKTFVQQVNSVLHNVFHKKTEEPRIPFKKLGKLEYALFLKNAGFKEGDYVVGKKMEPPYSPNVVHRIRYITEIHQFCEDYDYNGDPQAYQMESFAVVTRGTFWKSSLVKNFKVVEDGCVPQEWLDKK